MCVDAHTVPLVVSQVGFKICECGDVGEGDVFAGIGGDVVFRGDVFVAEPHWGELWDCVVEVGDAEIFS